MNKFDKMIYAIKCTKNRIKGKYILLNILIKSIKIGTRTKHLSLHEAQALASFSSFDENSYIVRYFNAWIEDERLYLVVKLVKF